MKEIAITLAVFSGFHVAATQAVSSQTPFAQQGDKFHSPGIEADGRFGNTVAMSGDLAVVGAFLEGGTGRAYLYARNLINGVSVWEYQAELAYLPEPGEVGVRAGDQFGFSVAIKGTVAVVGSRLADNPDGTPGVNHGAAYVFDLQLGGPAADTWVPNEGQKLTQLDDPDQTADPGDGFGFSVSTDRYTTAAGDLRDVIIVGTQHKRTVYLFSRPSAGGSFVRDPAIHHLISGSDSSGQSVAISGSTFAFGAPAGPGFGLVTLISLRTLTGTTHQAPDGFSGQQFGASVDIAPDTVLVGAPFDDDAGGASGAAYLYPRLDEFHALGDPIKLEASDASENLRFGTSVAIDGDFAVVGAQLGNSAAGAVYVFERNLGGPGQWGVDNDGDGSREEASIIASPETLPGDFFGIPSAISDTNILAGAPLDSDPTFGDGAGSAYFFGVSVPGETRSGGVPIVPVDAATGDAPVTLIFDDVTAPGVTTLTVIEGPATVAGFRLGDPPLIFDISTTAEFTGSVSVCIDYTGIAFEGPEEELRLIHENPLTGTWGDVTTTVDPTNNIICGSTTSFSQFAIAHRSFVEVVIDIKPNEFPNSINLGSNGNVPVAVLSSTDFDATTVDPTTVEMAGASVRIKGKGTPQFSLEDVNNDGQLDMVVHIDTEALQLTAGDVEVVLEGETTDGLMFRGTDAVRVVPE